MLSGLLTISLIINAQIKVLMIDTGVTKIPAYTSYLTNYIKDTHGHGTNVAGLILLGDGGTDPACSNVKLTVCQAFIKETGDISNCLDKIKKDEYDYINISGGGPIRSTKELDAIKRITSGKTVIVTAAGNDSKELGGTWEYFPASYKYEAALSNFIIAANGYNAVKRSPTTNYGPGVTWKNGTDVVVYRKTGDKKKTSGSSNSTALITHKLVMEKCRAISSQR